MKKRILFCLCCTIFTLSTWAGQAKKLGESPNIVFILADDMGYGEVGAYNPDSKVPTPCLNTLAREGMIFTDAHSGSAVCTPTRYGVLTGRYCWRTRLKSWVLLGYSRALIERGRMTVASLLKRNGYDTAMFGKWHLGMNFPTLDKKPANPKNIDWRGKIDCSPVHYGFDTFYGISASLDMPPFIWIEDDHFVGTCTTWKKWVRRGPAAAGFEAVDVLPEIGRRTVSYIESRKGCKKPFFIYMALTSPHTPVVPEKSFRGKTALGSYGDFCVQTDATVGKVLDALKRTGLEKDTLVIFTTDNGCAPYIGVKKLEAKGHFPSGPFRGYKADIFEGGHRVPYIVRWPGRVKAGGRSSELICLTDLMATCADIVQARLPNNAAEDSVSLLPVFLGQEEKNKPLREAVVHHSGGGNFSIRQGKWKLELCPGSGGWSDPKPGKACKGLPPVQLYDMSTDIKERKNVYKAHPDVVKRLSLLLDSYRKSGRSVPGRK